ncbi:transcription termination/antitermination NusG family protein [Oligosphaera ethanolica]|uniref:Transcription antitermination factor NusG n=1 Tax=Oligosphaera ethanolica TaxID=760260 RepID=A0AAE3VJR3_9BACT|nr:transcription termination/antitermination NusG family protein [Oligosphaera ethanolica]MDQ0291690.1 transcription antitermination factor NusG [Oligosphaera ethanolica]
MDDEKVFATEIDFDDIAPGRRWLPIYTQPLHERRLRDYLLEKSIPVYLPMVRKARYKNVRSNKQTYSYLQEVLRPMFSGYAFACLSFDEELVAWRSRSIVRVLKTDLSDPGLLVSELKTIRQIEIHSQEQPFEVLTELKPGRRVTIASGPWNGIEGVVEKREKKTVFVVNLDIMGQAVATEIDIATTKLIEMN